MTVRGFRQVGHPRSLVASLVHFDVSFMVWVLLGALGPYVASDLGLSSAQKGLMVAVPPLGGSLFRLVLGPLADRIGIKRLGLVTMAFTSVPLVYASTLADSYGEVLFVGLLLGVAGASFAVAIPLTSRWYPPEYQGVALGLAGAGNSGTVVSALAAPRLAEHVGWQGVFALALVPVACALLAFALLAVEPPKPKSRDKSGILSLLRVADARWLCAFYAVTFGGFVGISGYLPIFFVDRFGLTKVTAASYAALCAIAGSLLRPLGGSLSDRFGGTSVLTVVLGGVAALSLGLAALPGLGLTVLLLFVVLGLLGMGNGAVFQMVGVRLPDRVGSTTGLVGAAGGIGGFALPFLFGWLEERTGGFGTGFALLCGVATVAALAVLHRQRRWIVAAPVTAGASA
jgi:NNP family nitrate/nitrite transporter-like MFS transporter